MALSTQDLKRLYTKFGNHALARVVAANQTESDVTAGTAEASKSLVLDASKDIVSLRDVSLRNLIITGEVKSSSGAGAAATTGNVATETGDGVVHKTVLTCTAMAITTLGDEAGVGQFSGTKIYDFPAGLILTLGAVIDGSITLAAPAIDTWIGDIALGTAAPADYATGLVAADTGRYLQSTSTTIAVAKVGNVDAVSIATGLTESGARWTDGTATNADLYLNLLVDDNAAHNNTITGTFTGTVTFAWINLGDK